ncbi:MAG: DUF5673 domain-containing protein [Anaerococcus sp.]|nr:DUF5673 domain-containing protein [Anaerococcus sp.]
MNNLDSVIIILYAVIVVFFIYRIIKQVKEKNSLEGQVKAFKRPLSSFELILFSILLVTGGVNLYYGINQANMQNILTATVMILLAIVFLIASRAKVYVGENGILSNSKFSTFKEIRKWGFDPESGDLVMLIKDKKGENRESTKVRKEDIEEINTLIRRYKLGK